jgi:hypothetical protein
MVRTVLQAVAAVAEELAEVDLAVAEQVALQSQILTDNKHVTVLALVVAETHIPLEQAERVGTA